MLERLFRVFIIAVLLQLNRRERAHEARAAHLTHRRHRLGVRRELRPRPGFLRLLHRLLPRRRRFLRVPSAHDAS